MQTRVTRNRWLVVFVIGLEICCLWATCAEAVPVSWEANWGSGVYTFNSVMVSNFGSYSNWSFRATDPGHAGFGLWVDSIGNGSTGSNWRVMQYGSTLIYQTVMPGLEGPSWIHATDRQWVYYSGRTNPPVGWPSVGGTIGPSGGAGGLTNVLYQIRVAGGQLASRYEVAAICVIVCLIVWYGLSLIVSAVGLMGGR